MKTLIAAALLGTVAVGGIALAQTAAPAAKPLHGDANADGRVTRAEYVKQAETRFAALDVNRDGALTRDEMRAGRGHRGKGARMGAVGQDAPPPPPPGAGMRGSGRPGGGMMRQDTDGDGTVSRAEFDAQSATMFARMDANSDGRVDATEMAALPGGGRGAARADTNGDGILTREEFAAQVGQRFARFDMNADGVIDAAERQARPMGRGGRDRPAPAAAPTPSAPTGA